MAPVVPFRPRRRRVVVDELEDALASLAEVARRNRQARMMPAPPPAPTPRAVTVDRARRLRQDARAIRATLAATRRGTLTVIRAITPAMYRRLRVLYFDYSGGKKIG